MSEKKGNTVKLKFPFPEHWGCEIYLESLGRWHRVTPNEFRSFNTPRRILNVKDPKNIFYEDYHGPLFLLGTNKEVNPDYFPKGKLALPSEGDHRTFGKRGKWGRT